MNFNLISYYSQNLLSIFSEIILFINSFIFILYLIFFLMSINNSFSAYAINIYILDLLNTIYGFFCVSTIVCLIPFYVDVYFTYINHSLLNGVANSSLFTTYSLEEEGTCTLECCIPPLISYTNSNGGDIFSIVLLFLANITGVTTKLSLGSSSSLHNMNVTAIFSYFNLVILYFVYSNSLVEFFILYEFLLLPSFMVIYSLGYTSSSVLSSLYFLIWTQLGSILVLCAFIVFINSFNIEFFDCVNVSSIIVSSNYFGFVVMMVIFGFGINVPFWPFHYWITNTHVESPTGFSIYLSGFLVNTAVYGIYKVITLVGFYYNFTFIIWLLIVGFVDSSLKFWVQTDIKKLVAYCTIQEMNLIVLTLFLCGSSYISLTILFILTHALLSSLMFYLVDCIYSSYNSSSILYIQGIFNTCPLLGLGIILMQLCYIGIPGTSNFLVEFSLLSIVALSYPILFIFLLIFSLVGILGFSKIWFNLIFGCSNNVNNIIILDLTVVEFSIIFIHIFFQFFFLYLYSVLI